MVTIRWQTKHFGGADCFATLAALLCDLCGEKPLTAKDAKDSLRSPRRRSTSLSCAKLSKAP